MSCAWCGSEIIGARRWHNGKPYWGICDSTHHNVKYCRRCSDAVSALRGVAVVEVARAIRHKEIEPASAYNCTDCGAPAESYDHRNYIKPLSIEPVCRGCNTKRGPAISPYFRAAA